ncbi:MAG: type VI secretion system accessory protein TagJ [Planctomycetota bacterium]
MPAEPHAAERHVREGNLDAALKELQDLVRKEPAAAKHRVFLFQLLAVLGQWDRARTQLAVVRDLDARAIPMVQTYREALRCEVLRREVFAGKRSPLLFGEPAQWIAGVVQALMLSAQDRVEEAQAMRQQALAEAPEEPGTLEIALPPGGDQATRKDAFAWLADADSRLGPLLEAVINGKYYWVPWSAIATVTIEPPTDLRDLVWLPAQFRWRNGGDAVGLLPARYPGSADGEPALRLGRRTEWVDAGHGEFRGLGQKCLASDVGDYGLFDVRRIELATQAG